MRFAPLLLLSAAIVLGACSSNSESATDNMNAPSSSNSTSSVSYAEDATDINPVLTGTTIPNPTVHTVNGDSVRLMDLVSQKPTALIFYRGGWCPYCSEHMAELQQAESKLVEIGYQLLAISPDRPEKLKESIAEYDLSYTLISDSPMKAASAFGLAFKVDQETLKRYDEAGIDLEASSDYDHHLLPVPTVYLVDTEGMIHFQYVNPDYQTRINSNVLLTAAEEYYPEEVES